MLISTVNPGEVNGLTANFMKRIFKESYEIWINDTDCAAFRNWNGSISECTNNSCPGGKNEPVYSEDIIEATEQILIDRC